MLMKESEKDDFLREQQKAQIHRQKSLVSHAWNSWEVKIWENDQDALPQRMQTLAVYSKSSQQDSFPHEGYKQSQWVAWQKNRKRVLPQYQWWWGKVTNVERVIGLKRTVIDNVHMNRETTLQLEPAHLDYDSCQPFQPGTWAQHCLLEEAALFHLKLIAEVFHLSQGKFRFLKPEASLWANFPCRPSKVESSLSFRIHFHCLLFSLQISSFQVLVEELCVAPLSVNASQCYRRAFWWNGRHVDAKRICGS